MRMYGGSKYAKIKAISIAKYVYLRMHIERRSENIKGLDFFVLRKFFLEKIAQRLVMVYQIATID